MHTSETTPVKYVRNGTSELVVYGPGYVMTVIGGMVVISTATQTPPTAYPTTQSELDSWWGTLWPSSQWSYAISDECAEPHDSSQDYLWLAPKYLHRALKPIKRTYSWKTSAPAARYICRNRAPRQARS
jgi:hypothetical protein